MDGKFDFTTLTPAICNQSTSSINTDIFTIVKTSRLKLFRPNFNVFFLKYNHSFHTFMYLFVNFLYRISRVGGWRKRLRKIATMLVNPFTKSIVNVYVRI
jgi:hypothetical protein